MTEKRTRTERTADTTGKAAGAVGSTAASGFGAAQARNEFRNTYGEKTLERHISRLGSAAASVGASPKQQAKLVRVARYGRPGFKTLAAGSVAGGVAGASHVVEEREKRKRTRVVKSAADSPFAKALTDDQKKTGATLTGAAALIAAPRVHAAGHAAAGVRAAKTGSRLADDLARAHRPAGQGHGSPHKNPVMAAAEDIAAASGLDMRASRAQHAAAKTANPKGVKHMRPTADRYSATFNNARGIREAANNGGGPTGAKAVLHPFKAEAGLHARHLTATIDAAKHGDHPDLYRSQHRVGAHKVGDEVDFGRLSSFSSNQEVTRHIGDSQTKLQGLHAAVPKQMQHGPLKPTTPAGSKPVTYRVPAGSTKAANIGAATDKYAQHEWLAGGKYRVKHIDRDGVHHLEPVNKSYQETVFAKVRDSARDAAAGAVVTAGGASVRSGRRATKESGRLQRESVAAHDAGQQARQRARDASVEFDQRLGRQADAKAQGLPRNTANARKTRTIHAENQALNDQAWSHAERARNLARDSAHLRRVGSVRSRAGLVAVGAGGLVAASNRRR